MDVVSAAIPGVLLFVPAAHYDERGFFTRTFDAEIAAACGLRPEAFIQDSQSRSRLGTIRGMHGRIGLGESKLVRCARGAVFDVLVDARPGSPTFGLQTDIRLDDESFVTLYVPAGILHGFQAITAHADVCYRIDREHDPTEDVAVKFDDPDLAIAWPLPPGPMSERDLSAGSWAQLVQLVVQQINGRPTDPASA